jgi:hypothetical protein
MLPKPKSKPRSDVPAETIERLAMMLAEYRLGGCPSGGAVAVQDATREAAKKHGRSYSELWPLVHAAAYRIIDADPRSALHQAATFQNNVTGLGPSA